MAPLILRTRSSKERTSPLENASAKGPCRHFVPHFLQERQCFAHDSPGNRIGAGEPGYFFLQLAELAIKSVVGAVGELRRVQRVVLAGVMREQFLKLRDSFFNLLRRTYAATISVSIAGVESARHKTRTARFATVAQDTSYPCEKRYVVPEPGIGL